MGSVTSLPRTWERRVYTGSTSVGGGSVASVGPRPGLAERGLMRCQRRDRRKKDLKGLPERFYLYTGVVRGRVWETTGTLL